MENDTELYHQIFRRAHLGQLSDMCMIVTDSGIACDEEYADRIFLPLQPFYFRLEIVES